jgi:hypothetical protein
MVEESCFELSESSLPPDGQAAKRRLSRVVRKSRESMLSSHFGIES